MANSDVVILATQKNLRTLERTIPYVKKNIPCNSIYIIASKEIQSDINKIRDVKFVDEDLVYDGMSFEKIGNIIEELTGKRKKVGWYFQQFLKLAWTYHCKDKYYVVIDSDTYPLNKIEFVNNGKYLFTKKIEYNKPYFDTIETLFDGQIKRVGNFSFVAEHMPFDCMIVKEMLDKIEKKYANMPFYEAILRTINVEDLEKSGFSEFETYGSYIMTLYPEKVELRKLRTLREAAYTLGGMPSNEKLEWASEDFDIISIEVPDYGNTIFTWLGSLKFVRNIIHYRTLAKCRARIRTLYRRIIKKRDFKFDSI